VHIDKCGCYDQALGVDDAVICRSLNEFCALADATINDCYILLADSYDEAVFDDSSCVSHTIKNKRPKEPLKSIKNSECQTIKTSTTTRHLWESLCIRDMVVHRAFHSVIYNWRKDMKFLQTMQYFIVSFFYLFSLSVASDDFMLRELLFYTSFEYLFNKYF
jgi:hypothetical protein